MIMPTHKYLFTYIISMLKLIMDNFPSSKTVIAVIHEQEYNPQAEDAFKRFTKMLGRTFSKKGGKMHKVWTNFKVYCHPPTLEHPLTIKIGLHNKMGKTFCQMPIKEFDDLLDELMEWRISHDEEITNLLMQEKILSFRRDFINTLKAGYSVTDKPIVEMKQTSQIFSEPEEVYILKIKRNIEQFLSSSFRNNHTKKDSIIDNWLNDIIEDCNKLTDPQPILDFLQEQLINKLEKKLEKEIN